MSRTKALPQPHFPSDSHLNATRNIPILPSATSTVSFSQAEPMEVTTPPPTIARMGPPNSSPEMDHDMQNRNGSTGSTATEVTPIASANGSANNSLSAASAGGPKVVQTAFIHKLYNMLEDQSIRNLISWSPSNESFVMQPSPEFSKVLAQYFKHTNISSFVRQLNMYGFHKVSDVFHTGAPDSALWEFKHGGGNFKRGDLNGLREIKRRASRHTLIHRESFSSPHKPSVSQPGTPAEPVQEQGDPRLLNIEHNLYDMHTRLARTEESNSALSSKCAFLSDSLARCQQWNNDLAKVIMKMLPDQESQTYRDLSLMQKDIARQSEMFRQIEDPHESLMTGRQPFFGNMQIDTGPLSPRQTLQEERHPSIQAVTPRGSVFRPPPPHVAMSPRRYGSIGNSAHNPPYQQRPSVSIQPPLPPPQHPLASVEPSPNLARRHTSADIRDTVGWPPQPGASGHQHDGHSPNGAPHWPPSPQNLAPNPSDQHVRDMLASYEIGGPRRKSATSRSHSRAASPPGASHSETPPGNSGESGWGFSGGKLAPRIMESAPQTRRSSMASNVHNLLNPAQTAEREEDEGAEDRKRKRLT